MRVWICLLLVLAIFTVYAQVRNHEFINYDDPEYVTENPHVTGGLKWDNLVWLFTHGYAAYWFPLTWISHALDYQLFGLRAGWHHLTNVLLHALSTVLLFTLLFHITGAQWRSAFVAFVFALHPLHVESVAWVAERKDVLSGLFWFLTLWAYVRYTERVSVPRYLLVVVTFGLGLMSKPMIVTLPFVALLLDLWPLRRSKPWSVLVLEKLPLLALSIAVAVVTFIVQQRGGSVTSVGLAIRIENVLIAYVGYLIQFVYPAGLAVFYPYAMEPPVWQAIGSGLALAVVTILAVKEILRRPYLAAGWFWYLGTLVPVIGLVQSGAQAHADRYTYIPMIGISIMLAWGAAELLPARVLAPVTAAVCCIWMFVTWTNLEYWKNSITLFQHATEATNGNYIAHNNLAAALKRKGRITEAISEFQLAVASHPQDAVTQDNLGEALLSQGRVGEAMPRLEDAVRLQPDLVKARIDLGNALTQSGRADEALAQYRAALQLRPDSAEAHYGIGAILMSQGHSQEALPHLEQALPYLMDVVRKQPDYADGHFNLAALLTLLGRKQEAIQQMEETVRLQPGDADAQRKLEELRK
jgi:tetratricopeptide (TPR) repeat protein